MSCLIILFLCALLKTGAIMVWKKNNLLTPIMYSVYAFVKYRFLLLFDRARGKSRPVIRERVQGHRATNALLRVEEGGNGSFNKGRREINCCNKMETKWRFVCSTEYWCKVFCKKWDILFNFSEAIKRRKIAHIWGNGLR